MTLHLAVYHANQHLAPVDYLKYGMVVPHRGGAGQVHILKTKLKDTYLTWFVLESDTTHYDGIFLLLDKSVVTEDNEHFKKFAGEAIAFWLEAVAPKQYYVKILEDNSRLITIEASDVTKLTEFFNTKWKGAPHEIQIPETHADLQDASSVVGESGSGQSDPQPE